MTEIHIASARDKYRSWILQKGTGLGCTDHTFDFAVASNEDLFCFEKRTGAEAEVHVLSHDSTYETVNTIITRLRIADGNYKFFVASERDVLCVRSQSTQ